MNDVDGNVENMIRTMGQLALQGVHLAVFPELATTGYMFESPAEALAVAEDVPDGPTVHRLAEACARHDMHIVFGIAEKSGDHLYNASVLLGPDGYVGTYRKLHLWNDENTIFTQGNLGLPAFKTPLGTVGMLICYDMWFPESARSLALSGAELLCVPTNWVPLVAGDDSDGRTMANVLCMANAHCNGIPVVAADRCGVERGQHFLGRSLITHATGWPAAGPASPDLEETLIAEIDVEGTAAAREWNAFNNPLTNRRTDAYALD
jgi:predicted amidohydrolase